MIMTSIAPAVLKNIKYRPMITHLCLTSQDWNHLSTLRCRGSLYLIFNSPYFSNSDIGFVTLIWDLQSLWLCDNLYLTIKNAFHYNWSLSSNHSWWGTASTIFPADPKKWGRARNGVVQLPRANFPSLEQRHYLYKFSFHFHMFFNITQASRQRHLEHFLIQWDRLGLFSYKTVIHRRLAAQRAFWRKFPISPRKFPISPSQGPSAVRGPRAGNLKMTSAKPTHISLS